MPSPTVFQMVSQVLADSRSKLKEAEAACGEGKAKEKEPEKSEETSKDFSKIADACDYLAEHLNDVVDTRSPHEKLAEFAEVQEALLKAAQDDIPMNPPLDSGVNPGGPGTALQAVAANAPGTSLDAGESGEATPPHLPPKVSEPSEKPQPTSPSNAMETNQDMMMPEQPEDVLKQARAIRVLQKVGKAVPPALAARARAVKAAQNPTKPGAETMSGGTLKKSAADFTYNMARQGHIPARLAGSILNKMAEDALNPAQISGGTNPILQSVPGVPSAQMQGSATGELTPREAAPNVGEGAGRELLSSNEAAINATKGQAKKQNKGALAEILTEPAMSSAHDQTLQKSLDNTDRAGVKIAAQRELLKKLASSSPDVRRKIEVLIKMAQGEELTPEESEMVGEGASPEEMIAAQAIADAAASGAAQDLAAEKAGQAAGAPATGAPPVAAQPASPVGGVAGAPPPAMAAPAGAPVPPVGQVQ